ncbi:MAG: winged helix-turn-helix domain-containing protein [Anaerolineales bacterium]
MSIDIFCVEGNHGKTYHHQLEQQGFTTQCVSTGKTALTALKTTVISHGVLLNAYSMDTSGVRIGRRIKSAHPELPVVHVTDGSSTNLVADLVLAPEPSIRIQVNRFELFSHFDLEQCTRVEDLVLDEENGRVKTPEGVSSLTPKMTALLKMLMEHTGEAVEKNELYRTVWDTEYVGDIRSLHDHIKLLWDAVGGDSPSHRYIETIRGKGYRLKAGS